MGFAGREFFGFPKYVLQSFEGVRFAASLPENILFAVAIDKHGEASVGFLTRFFELALELRDGEGVCVHARQTF